jgi:hypothetical protein
MATIHISDIQSKGAALFSDSESYLSDLTVDEQSIAGGIGNSRIPPLTTFPISNPMTPMPPSMPTVFPFPQTWPSIAKVAV